MYKSICVQDDNIWIVFFYQQILVIGLLIFVSEKIRYHNISFHPFYLQHKTNLISPCIDSVNIAIF